MQKLSGRFFLAVAVVSLAAGSHRVAAEELNTLSPSEEKAGWKLLFDGKSTDGWRNYLKDSINDGWQVQEGALTRTAKGAGDIITDQEFDSFELTLEFKISPGGNSGVMYHVIEKKGVRPPFSGPEIQIQDNVDGHDAQKCGWLYQLYKAPIDATKPAGEWNRLRIRITPKQCATYMNGVRYARYVKGSPDWNRRVAASKFANSPEFGKATKGHICLQDHGNEVAYRNIKVRKLDGNIDAIDPVDGKLAYRPALAFPKLKWTGWSPFTENGKPQPLRPIVLTHAGDGSNLIYVATQQGVIHSFPADPNAEATQVVLDLTDRVRYSDRQNEEGFLGMAIHPEFKKNGQIFAYYTTQNSGHTSVVSRFTVKDGKGDPESEEILMEIEQPYWNHNGGSIEFGPDGMLYIGLGDGGAGNDPHSNGQNVNQLLGSVLRIDVDRKEGDRSYAIPADNPFREGDAPEIWAYGLRNVWRLGFDRATGDLWVADVGQELWEEINIVTKGGNYGWNLREGAHPFGAKGAEQRDDLIDPIWEYDHEIGRSITGGYVYRGSRLPELAGRYLYADYISGRLWALKYDRDAGKVVSNHALHTDGKQVISFGEDEAGEVYFMVVDARGEGIYRFEPAK